MQEKISSINGQLESLHFEIGMKAGIMLAISLELEKCPSAKTE